MAQAITEEMLEEINHWRMYRDPNHIPLTIKDATKMYRTFPYTPPAALPPRAPRNITSDPSIEPEQVTPISRVFQDFLNKTVAGIPGNPAHWRGTKFLGSGGTAMAGLWEWIAPPEIGRPPYTQVVVKELQPGHMTDAIYNESMFLEQTNYASQHIVNMLHPAYALKKGALEGLDDSWDGIYIRMFQEYCSHGSLEQLLSRRIDL